jgi:DNA mismatch repair protein MutS
MTEPSTPLMRQYAAVKKEHPTALLFFRLGDFYELFFDDAIVAAKELQITLTSRNKEKGIAVPMCGVPHHAAEGYIGKLIRKGFKVAICEQMEDARLAKKLVVRREVTRVVTPGTAADSCWARRKIIFWRRWLRSATAWVSRRSIFPPESFAPRIFRRRRAAAGAGRTGATAAEGVVVWLGGAAVRAGLSQARPTEGRSVPAHTSASRGWGNLHRDSARRLDLRARPCHSAAGKSFRSLSLEGFGLAGRTAAAAAAGAILYYVRSTQRGSLDHVDRIGWYERQNCLVLDAVTVRNLELIEPLFAGTDAGVTLFRSIDAAVTPMGKRLLRAWLLRPSLDLAEINARLDAVEAGVKATIAREELRRALDGVLDLERLLSRVTLETANPRDVLALAASLAKIPAIKAAVRETWRPSG